MKLDLQILDSREIDPAKWDHFILGSPQGCLYAQYGYATAVAPGWKAYVLSQDATWLAVMPFAPKRKWGINYLPHPVFCQYWGVFFAPLAESTGFSHYRIKHAIVEALAEVLCSFSRVTQNFAPEFDYPLPFAWKGFRLEMRITYHLKLDAPLAQLWEQSSPALRRQIRKAQKHELKAVEMTHPDALWKCIQLNVSQGNAVMGNIANWRVVLEKIWNYLKETGQAQPLQVVDRNGEVQAAGLFVRFREKTLYLTGAQHPEATSSGAMDFLMWEAISQARASGSKVFDFEGSMIEGVERFFRKFGPYPVSYLQIVKNELPLLP